MQDKWYGLKQHHQEMEKVHLRDLFLKDNNRFSEFSILFEDILWDYSKQRVTKDTIEKFCQLASHVKLKDKIEALFKGEAVNFTEKRPALHTALRDFSHTKITVDKKDIQPVIQETRERLYQFADDVRKKIYKGATQKNITDILSLGIGGSDLGPRLTCDALEPYKTTDLKCHFLSNIDGYSIEKVLKNLNPETTLCIVNSKNFTTPETLLNAKTVLDWFKNTMDAKQALQHHFVAVTANKSKAHEWGIAENHIFDLWKWVGGRYSIWSAVGLTLLLTIGKDHFQQFLQGAYKADMHFKGMTFSKNIPVLMAFLGIWNINFFNCQTHAILPYCDRLELLPSYLQQLEMESNGKQMRLDLRYSDDVTAPVIWGGVGCNGQHAYMQLLHQSPAVIPVDFILPVHSQSHFPEQDVLMVQSCLSQSKALMEGVSEEEMFETLSKQGVEHASLLAHARTCPGNRPSSTFIFPKVTPNILGSLLAFYEHKVFVQSVIWNINPFDQWGVELGKALIKGMQDESLVTHEQSLDSSTLGLLEFSKKV